MKEERMAILRMLENGVISAEEAERLLNVLNENREKDTSEDIGSAFAKAGKTLESIVENVGRKAGQVAKVVGDKTEQAKPEIKKAAKTVAEKVTEAAETIKEDFNKRRAAKESADETDFVYEGEPKEDPTEETKVDDTVKSSSDESTVTENESAEKAVDYSNTEEKEVTSSAEIPEEDDDGRDYEAEYYQMMKETNGGDIFGDVYKAIDNLNGIAGNKDVIDGNADDNKTDKE